jgi:hypothetical protein
MFIFAEAVPAMRPYTEATAGDQEPGMV